MDISTINFPECLDSRNTPPTNHIYTYAEFLVPGLHKFLIYDPVTHRAYCKVLVIDSNRQYFYSDQPACIHDKKFKSMKNIKRNYTLRNYWREFKNNEKEHMSLCFFNDRTSLIKLPELNQD